MVSPAIRQLTTALFAGLLLVSIGSTTALAHDADAEDSIDLGSHVIRVTDASVHVEDLHLRGDGLPERSIDDRSTAIDGEYTLDGFTVTVNGQTVEVGHTHVVLEDVGVTVDDVSIGGEEV